MSRWEHEWKLHSKCGNDLFIQEQLMNVRNGSGYDPFYPAIGENAKANTWSKKYCSSCPVKLACTAEAMKSLQLPQIEWHAGIWGGTTMRSRVALKKRQTMLAQQMLEQLTVQLPDTNIPNEDSKDVPA